MLTPKQSGTAYLLWLGGIFGFCGLHRFYVGSYATGFLWLFTFGLCGLGQFIDLFLIPGLVDRRNAELYRQYGTPAANVVITTLATSPNVSSALQTPMQRLLTAAKDNGGTLSLAQAALATRMDTAELRTLLLEAQRDGYAEIYNDEASGAVRYRFDV